MGKFKERFLKSSMLAKQMGIELINDTKIMFEVQDEGTSKTSMKGNVVGLTCAVNEIIYGLAQSTDAKPEEILEVLQELNDIKIGEKGEEKTWKKSQD